MPEEKKSLSITITDLDDFTKVCEALDHLLETIILHYTDTNAQYLKTLVLSLAIYIGELTIILGFSEKDLPFGDNKNE